MTSKERRLAKRKEERENHPLVEKYREAQRQVKLCEELYGMYADETIRARFDRNEISNSVFDQNNGLWNQMMGH